MQCSRAHTRPGEAGFTLIEALAALAVLSVAFVSLYQAHASGHRLLATSDAYGQARIVAQSLLAETTAETGKIPRSSSGRSHGFDWSVDVTRSRAGWAEIQSVKDWGLYHVRVSVMWDRRVVHLDTLKLGRPNE